MNVFDQFDTQPVSASVPADGNAFDQFDEQPPATPSVTKDVAKSVGSNLLEGAASVPMILPNIVNAAAAGPQMLYRGIRDTFKGAPTDNSPLWQPLYGSSDVVHAAGLDYQPKTIAGAAAVIPSQVVGSLLAPTAGRVIKSTGTAAGSTAKTIAKGATARDVEELQAAQAVNNKSTQTAYKTFTQSGASFTPAKLTQISTDIDAELSKAPLIPELHPQTIGVIKDLKAAITKGNMNLSTLDQYRQMLGGISGQDGIAASAVRRAIDNNLGKATQKDFATGGANAVKLLTEARATAAREHRFNDVSDIIIKANGDAKRIQSGLTRFLADSDNHAGFTTTELDTIRAASKSGLGQNLTKLLGMTGLDLKPSYMNLATTGAAGMYGTPALPVVGTIAKAGQKAFVKGQAEKALDLIQNRTTTAPQPQVQTAPATNMLKPTTVAAMLSAATPASATLPPQTPQQLPKIAEQQPTEAPALTPDLFQRVIQQESRGNQSAVSNKGAIGIAQIMPKTAPEAAKLAGLPFDSMRLRTDPEYNAALGKAYLDKMVEKYQSEPLALMAYNWGQGNVDLWLKSGADPKRIPTETRNYLNRILGG